MEEILKCIEKYIDIMENEKFVMHWKELAWRLQNGLKEDYQQKLKEPEVVKTIERIINGVGEFTTNERNLNFSISTKSIFIHGSKSVVEFKCYYDKPCKRELGDIIFILSVVYNGQKYFEKITINQIKKSYRPSWTFATRSAREQLYLLSRFPVFEGIKGSLIPKRKYNLSNNSGCLGTYGLLYPPGDLALISAKWLEAILAGKTNINLAKLSMYVTMNTIWNYALSYYKEYLSILFNPIEAIRFYPSNILIYPHIHNLPILSNRCIAYNVYDFSEKYLKGFIGELIYAKAFLYNKSALDFLQDFMAVIKNKAEKESLEKILDFVNNFPGYGGGDRRVIEAHNEFDYSDGGIGIIHTIVNLGE